MGSASYLAAIFVSLIPQSLGAFPTCKLSQSSFVNYHECLLEPIPIKRQYTGKYGKMVTNYRRKCRFFLEGKQREEDEGSAISTINNELNSKEQRNTLNKKINEEPNSANLWDMPRDSVVGPLVLLMLSQLILFCGVGAVIPSIPIYGKEIGLSSSANGIVISAPAVALLLGSKLGGNYADLARKPAMMYGMAIIALADFGTACATTLPSLVAARLGLGIGQCVSKAGERGMLADLAQRVPQQRGRILAAQQACFALGIAIGAPIGGIVVETYGPRAAFLCVTAAALVALILYAFLPETIVNVPNNPNNPTASTQENNYKPVVKVEWKALLQQPEWKGLALSQSGASFGYAAKIASIPLLATANLPGGAAGAGLLLSAAGLSGLVGAPLGGWLTDHLGARTTATCSGLVSATALIIVPFCLQASQLVSENSNLLHWGDTMNLSLEALTFSIAVMIWGLGVSAQAPALTAIAQELAPSGAEATSLALPRAAGDGTYIVAPFLLGLVTDNFPQGPMGIECAVAGAAILFGSMTLAFSTSSPKPEF